MAATLEQDHSAVFSGVTWDFYWKTREEIDSKRQITFDGERMEIMSSPISLMHDDDKTLIARLFEFYCFVKNVPLTAIGSVTLADEELDRGCEADEAYYIHATPLPRGIRDIDLQIHNAPDLVIEVDLTSRSVSKEPVYAAMKVVEVWRWHEGDLTVRRLVEGTYQTVDDSVLLPELSIHDLADHVRLGRRKSQPEVFQAWRTLLGQA